MKEPSNRIGYLENEWKLLHSSKTALLSERKKKKLNKENYEFQKTVRESDIIRKVYSKKLEEKLKTAKEEIEEQKEIQRYKEHKPSIAFAVITMLLLSLTMLSNYEGITGYMTFTKEQTMTTMLNETFADNTILELEFTNATSLRISGEIIGRGKARVLLDLNGTLLTVMDKDTSTKEASNIITGLVIGDETMMSITDNTTTENISEEPENVREEVIKNISEEIVENIILENITEEITENITTENITTENITTENITTENITEEIMENITIEKVTENIIENISENIQENITIENITTELEENITEIIIENITEEITKNITTENITTENITTENITTENITTENITNIIDENITTEIIIENITTEIIENVTENITENITEEITEIFEFTDECFETCSINIPKGRLLIELEGVKLKLDSIKYNKKVDNKPPIQTKKIENISFYYEYELNASEYFEDPENDSLIYDIKSMQGIKTNIKEGKITLETNKTSTHETFVYATDGSSLVKSNKFTIKTGTEKTIINKTQSLLENTTQYSAVINKPVKWKKEIKVSNATGEIIIALPEEAKNIIVKEEKTQIEISTEKISVVENNTRKKLEQYEVEKNIKDISEELQTTPENKELKKELKTLETKHENLITGQVILEDTKPGFLTRMLKAFADFISSAEITGRVVQDVPTAIIEENTSEEIVENITEIIIENSTEEIIENIITENITIENITEEIIENYTTEIIENITTENITIENITEEIIENNTTEIIENITTENISKEIIENVTEEITENITTENITEEIMENITIKKVTENIIKNISENIQENITIENITTENITEEITENITTENITTEIEETEINISEKEISLIIEDNATEIIIEYETEAPQLIEEEISKYKKLVTISSKTHYENVLTYTEITPSPKENIALYWIQNGSRTLFKDVNYLDTDGDELIDVLEWIVPHLSNQTFEISITVLNVQSYPLVGSYWTVMLNTSGIADLEITPYNLTSFLPEPIDYEDMMDDLEFNDFKCGNSSMKEELWITTTYECGEIGNTTCNQYNNKTFVKYKDLMQTNLSVNISSLYIYNYTCENTSYLEDKVRTPGGHHLLFEFGPVNATAHNWAVKNATSTTVNATISIRRPSDAMTSISGAYMLLNHTTTNTQSQHDTTWVYNYTKDCAEEGDYELYAELLSLGNSESEKDTTSISEAITYWVDGCIIDGSGKTSCTVHAKSKNTNSNKNFGGKLELMNNNCNITSVSGDANRYYTSDGQDTCSGTECGEWIEFYHTVGTSDNTDETTFAITCSDGSDDNTPMMLNMSETCGPASCGQATIGSGGYDDCNDPTCTDRYTYIGNDTVESLGGFDLMTYDIGMLDTFGWSTVSTYNIAWDTDSTDCDCYIGATTCEGSSCYNTAGSVPFPDSGSNYNSNCCGDDSNEYYNITNYDVASLESNPTTSDACCIAKTRCVYASTCYASTVSRATIDSDSDTDYCLKGVWYDCGSDSDCPSGWTCSGSNDCEDQTPPTVTFVSPTPGHDTREISNSVTINVTAVDTGNDVDSCWIEWDDGSPTNDSMTKSGSGQSVSCKITKATTDGDIYTYKVFANDTAGVIGNTSYRNFTENTKPVAPTHSTPTNGAKVIGNSQTITWSAGSDADGDTITYFWYIDTDNPPASGYTCNGSTTGTTSSACETTDGTTYYWNIETSDGYENQTTTTAWSFIENSVPTISAQTITPVSPTTNDNLNCSFTIADSENSSLYVYYKWYNGSSIEQNSGISMASGVENSIILGSGNTTKSETWYCEITPYDGYENGTAQNSSVTISDSTPTVTLTAPINNSVLTQYTNRTPYFTWSGSDADGDSLTYKIWIAEDSGFSNVNQTSNTGNNEYYESTDIKVDTSYWWIVEAYDGNSRANSTYFNLTLESYESITLLTSTTDFGDMEIGNQNDTTNNNPDPFKIRNVGNIYVNLTLVAQDALWSDPIAGLDTAYFKFKADNVTGEEGSFNYVQSQTSWYNMPSSTTNLLKDFDFHYSTDEAEVDLFVETPPDETAGSKSSTITIST